MHKILFVILIVLHVALLIYVASRTSPNHDESANLVAGLSIWKYGQFDLYPVNPPIHKMIASFPLLFCKPEVEWKLFDDHLTQNRTGSRPEFSLGLSFTRANIDSLQSYLFVARLMCLPFVLLGAYFCWRWAKELYGEWAGLTALTLWCFCPNVLTWGSMVMPDLPAASFGVMTGYFFWKWLKNNDHNSAFVAGLTLGLVLLTKLTWVFLLLLYPLVWIVWYFSREDNRTWLLLRQRACQMVAMLAIAVFALNLGYGFEGTFIRLGDYRFASRTLAGKDSTVDGRHGGNRFAETPLALVPVPLPKNYVLGADLQKVDFEKGLPSYLFGQWQYRGWWYYYIVCAALKVPLGTWGLGFLTVGFLIAGIFYRRKNGNGVDWCDQLVFLAPAVVLFVFVSSQTGFSRHFRYVLPALPFAFIWISQIVQIAATRRSLVLQIPVVGLLAWSIISSLSVYPHSMSYFNELAGGPKNGHKYLLDSNIDWGQDVFYFQDWLKKHPEVSDLHLLMRDDIAGAFFLADGFPVVPLAPGKSFQTIGEEDNDPRKLAPRPGWFAASIHQINAEHGRYKYLLDFEPVDIIGYSIYIYNISLEEANVARKRHGLPEIPVPQNNLDKLHSRFAKNTAGESVISIMELTNSNSKHWRRRDASRQIRRWNRTPDTKALPDRFPACLPLRHLHLLNRRCRPPHQSNMLLQILQAIRCR